MSGTSPDSTELAERRRIGATIRVLREARGLKPDQLANSIQISRPYLANIEAGRKPLTPVLLGRVAAALNSPHGAIVREGYFVSEQVSA